MEQFNENEKGFYTEVIEASRSKLILVNFYRPTGCAPCTNLKPILEQNSKERSDYITYNVNTEDRNNVRILQKYQVMRVPTLILFSVGKPVASHQGFLTKIQLNNWLDNFKEAEWKEVIVQKNQINSHLVESAL